MPCQPLDVAIQKGEPERSQLAPLAVLGADGKAILKIVQLGRDFGDSVEVTAGLAPQDRVIDSPAETLQNGDAVQLAAALPASPAPQTAASMAKEN
jgi:hypothetical protein